MANYASLKAAIQQVVKTNGNNEITGSLLQQSLLAMINSLGGYYQFAGIATPSTNPGTPDQNVFYFASTAGTYANFGGLVLADGEIAILKYNGAWSKNSTGAASLENVNQLAQYLLNNSFIGNGNTYVQKNIQGLVPGRKYLFVLKSNEWDMSGVTTTERVYKFILGNRYNEQTTTIFASVLIGSGSTVNQTYIIEIPSESDYVFVGGRATQGVEVFFNIYDITNIVALQGEIDENKQSIISLEQSFSEKDEIIFKYPYLPGNTTSRIFRAVNFIAGRKYHYKIEPNGFVPVSTLVYAISLRTCETASSATVLENIVIITVSEYNGQVIEGDFIPTQDAPYIYIYTGESAEKGSGIIYTITEVVNEDKELQNSLSERMLETSIIPSTLANTAIFPAFKMYAGKSYQVDVVTNGYLISTAAEYPIVIRAMKTPYINGTSDPNIVATIESQVRTVANYAPGDFSIQYHAIADSEYIQLYCGRASVVGSGIQLRVRELCMTSEDSVSDSHLSVSSYGVAKALGRSGDFAYNGRILDLHTHKTTIAEALRLGTGGNQGCDITSGYLFQAFDGGRCRVYDFGRRKPLELGNFMFACASADNHFNCINFGVEIPAGCSFPAIYITTGKADSPVEYVCHVEGITELNGVYTSALLQTITLDTSNWEANGYMRIFGGPHWFVDKERGYLWVFSAKLRTTQEATGEFKNNKYIATQFRLPAISEGNLVLDASDILRQVIFEFDTYFTQGGTMKDGKIYYCFGLGDATYPANVRVFDTDDGSVATRMNAVLTTEPEDMTEYEGELYLVNASGMVYQLTS